MTEVVPVNHPSRFRSDSTGAPTVLPVRQTRRSALAASRIPAGLSAMAECRLCAHDCGVDRLAGRKGICRAGPEARVFCAQLDSGDESELVPTFAIAFSGCDLRCSFCITHLESWNPGAGEPLNVPELAARASEALATSKARTVMFLGGEPTIHLPAVLRLVAALPDTARLVWKTNAHGSQQARELLDGLFDVWLPDYKFGNDDCAKALAGVPDYTRLIRENLVWAARHSELIVRHLLMPGHLDCCWARVATWLAAKLPGIKVSLRDGFWPRFDAADKQLRRSNTEEERQRAFALGCELGLHMVV